MKIATKDYQQKGAYPIIDQGQRIIAGYTDNTKSLLPDGEYVLFGDHTCSVKYYNGRFAQGADGLKILQATLCIPKYLYYCMCSYGLKSSEYMRHWTSEKRISIPIPPLVEQNRIVAILDRFEALTSDLSSGLPAEIKARRQQYEHYRDSLLSFPRKEA